MFSSQSFFARIPGFVVSGVSREGERGEYRTGPAVRANRVNTFDLALPPTASLYWLFGAPLDSEAGDRFFFGEPRTIEGKRLRCGRPIGRGERGDLI
jgi:hypothetical protein